MKANAAEEVDIIVPATRHVLRYIVHHPIAAIWVSAHIAILAVILENAMAVCKGLLLTGRIVFCCSLMVARAQAAVIARAIYASGTAVRRRLITAAHLAMHLGFVRLALPATDLLPMLQMELVGATMANTAKENLTAIAILGSVCRTAAMLECLRIVHHVTAWGIAYRAVKVTAFRKTKWSVNHHYLLELVASTIPNAILQFALLVVAKLKSRIAQHVTTRVPAFFAIVGTLLTQPRRALVSQEHIVATTGNILAFQDCALTVTVAYHQ